MQVSVNMQSIHCFQMCYLYPDQNNVATKHIFNHSQIINKEEWYKKKQIEKEYFFGFKEEYFNFQEELDISGKSN